MSNQQGNLRAILMDATGKVLRETSTSAIRRAADWRYVAVEWNSSDAVSARVAFWVKGKADLDDVTLVPTATSFIGNSSVGGDDRGRIGLRNEKQNTNLLAGRRLGNFALDSDVKRSGKTSVRLGSNAIGSRWLP